MAMSIVNATEFSADNVSFSALRVNKARGNKTVYLSGPQRSKLNIQFPWMRAPKEWLGKPVKEAVLKEALYKPVIRAGKDDYASTMKLKVMVDNKTDKFVPEAYNMREETVSLETLEKGMKVIVIAEVASIWFIDNKFGVTVRLVQLLMEPPKKLPKFAFKGIKTDKPAPESVGDDEDEEVEYEDVEVDDQ